MTADEWRRGAIGCLPPEDAAWDADWMLCEALSCDKTRLFFRKKDSLTPEQEKLLEGWLARRMSGEPMQYILGYTEFMGLRFACDGRALIPRQDTETLAEEALLRLKGVRNPEVLDVCCGTGCIGLTIGKNRPDAKIVLSDLSEGALSLCAENARALGVRAERLEGDLFAPVGERTFDLIVCNPPYLTSEDMTELQMEVRSEPEMALFGGQDGLDFYRRLAKEAMAHLRAGGSLLMECGMGQARDIEMLFDGQGETQVIQDLCGVERVVAVRRNLNGKD